MLRESLKKFSVIGVDDQKCLETTDLDYLLFYGQGLYFLPLKNSLKRTQTVNSPISAWCKGKQTRPAPKHIILHMLSCQNCKDTLKQAFTFKRNKNQNQTTMELADILFQIFKMRSMQS